MAAENSEKSFGAYAVRFGFAMASALVLAGCGELGRTLTARALKKQELARQKREEALRIAADKQTEVQRLRVVRD